MRTDYLCSGHPSLQIVSDIPDEFDDPLDHKALAFNYYEEAYTVWLDLIDDFVEPNQNLEERYGRQHILFMTPSMTLELLAKKNEQVQTELEEQSNRLDQAKSVISKLKSSSVGFFVPLHPMQLTILL